MNNEQWLQKSPHWEARWRWSTISRASKASCGEKNELRSFSKHFINMKFVCWPCDQFAHCEFANLSFLNFFTLSQLQRRWSVTNLKMYWWQPPLGPEWVRRGFFVDSIVVSLFVNWLSLSNPSSPQRNDLKGGNTDDKLMTGRTEGLMTVCQKAI